MYFLLAVSILVLGLIIDLSFFHLQLFRSLSHARRSQSLPLSEQGWEDIYFYRDKEISWLGYLAAISTLLGLLGTVLGIHSAFESMKLYKQASPEIFASGISQALLTTIFGLMIAIPSTLAMHVFRTLLDSLDRRIEVYFREML